MLFTYLQLEGVKVGDFQILAFSQACSWQIAFLHIIMFAGEVVILTFAVISSVQQFVAGNKLQIESEENFEKLKEANLKNKEIIDSTISVANSVNSGVLTARVQGNTTDVNIKALKDIINEMMGNLESKITTDINELSKVYIKVF